MTLLCLDSYGVELNVYRMIICLSNFILNDIDCDDGISEELVKSLVNVMEGTKMNKEILFEDTLLICQSSLASRLEGEIDLRSAIATYLKRNVLQYTISLLDFESSWKEMQSRFANRCLGDLSFTQFWQACILDCDSPDVSPIHMHILFAFIK